MTTDEFVAERQHARLTPAKSLRIVRELQELSQAQLASLSGIPQPTISAIENGQKGLGVERAKQLARVLKVHPAVLAFPNWEADENANVIPLRRPLPLPTVERSFGYGGRVARDRKRVKRAAARTRKKGAPKRRSKRA